MPLSQTRTLPGSTFAPWPRIRAMLATWRALARQRRALDRLDAHLLRDIGLDPARAAREARRAPWDVPAHWRDH